MVEKNIEELIYQEYCNSRFGFCISYPSTLEMSAPPANGDGRNFNDEEGFWMSASGMNNATEQSVDTVMSSSLNYFDVISYHTKGDNWFVLSGTKSNKIIYIKTFVGESGINLLHIQYPKSEETEYKKIVEISSKSFKPGALDEFL